ncbi:MAG: transposase [Candidatus Cloacimonetes bacterium]|nr:transposase [Candidatus Cloacimonadota bacterium]
MNKFSHFLGIDVSKDSFDAWLIDVKQNKHLDEKFNIDSDGFDLLVERLKKYNPKSILTILESTGVYHINLFFQLDEKGFKTAIVNPLLIHNFNKSVTLRKSKTDKIDAFRIACFTLHNHNNIELKNASSPSIRSLIR